MEGGYKYGEITNDVIDYINLLVRIAHTICNHPLYWTGSSGQTTRGGPPTKAFGERVNNSP